MSQLYGVSKITRYNWIRKYSSVTSTQAINMKNTDPEAEKIKQLKARIADLERALDRKQIQVDYHDELLRVLEENGVTIPKKDSPTKPAADSSDSSKEL